MPKRFGSWYFDGYKAVMEPRKDGRGSRRVLIYQGEWYGFRDTQAAQRRRKWKCALLSLVSIGAFLVAQFTPEFGGRNVWVALPGILAIIPMMFLLIGLFNYLLSKEKWEKRVYYAGYRRLLRSSAVQTVLLGLWLAMEVLYVTINRTLFHYEIHYLLAAMLSFGTSFGLVLLIRRHPVGVIQHLADRS